MTGSPSSPDWTSTGKEDRGQTGKSQRQKVKESDSVEGNIETF